jgi:hypothetical protein
VQVRHIALRLGLPLVFAVACGLCAISSAAQTSNQSRHVVVVVWDGMRPDFVGEQNTPTLWKLAHEGVTFRNHHSVYPSATNVNGTTLITGVYPGRNGIIANHVYRPDIDSRHAIDVENPAVVKRGDELSGGKYVSLSTIAELVQRAGGRTVIASAKTVGLLLDRRVQSNAGGIDSASPLAEGERTNVRESTRPVDEKAATLTLPSPSRRERRINSADAATGETAGAKTASRCSQANRCQAMHSSITACWVRFHPAMFNRTPDNESRNRFSFERWCANPFDSLVRRARSYAA